jgi:hypothetical protein
MSAETHEPGRWQASGQAGLGLMALQFDPVTTALPTARLAVGLSKGLRPTRWFPFYEAAERSASRSRPSIDHFFRR